MALRASPTSSSLDTPSSGTRGPHWFPGIRITLCMIVKNESAIITRLLSSLVTPDYSLIDQISILDTGSHDSTPEIINSWGKDHGIPTKVHLGSFRDFGTTRSEAFQLSKKDFPSDYTLLLDADHVICTTHNPPRPSSTILNKDYYLFPIQGGNLKYWRTSLIKTSLEWTCMGVTHEYWHGGTSNDRFGDVYIQDYGDGGSKSDKFERDKSLLHAGIVDINTPYSLRVRYYFYLAQTYRDLGDFKSAIEYYRMRIYEGGWEEEVYYSLLCVAKCLMALKRTDEGVSAYLEAWNYRPHRIEALGELATYYRCGEKFQLGYMFARTGKDILERVPLTKNPDILFLDTYYSTYGFDLEISICAFYCGLHEIGKEACINVLKNDIPEDIRELTVRNMRFYGPSHINK